LNPPLLIAVQLIALSCTETFHSTPKIFSSKTAQNLHVKPPSYLQIPTTRINTGDFAGKIVAGLLCPIRYHGSSSTWRTGNWKLVTDSEPAFGRQRNKSDPPNPFIPKTLHKVFKTKGLPSLLFSVSCLKATAKVFKTETL
jgi:hypothetical protein